MEIKIQSKKLQNGKWQPSFWDVQNKSGVYSDEYDFDKYFKTKDEADKHALEYLKAKGIEEFELLD
jgi:beta-lactamase superfamily II metal-dependent hydrolase